MAPKLVVASGKSAGRTISIKREKLLVGRADECDVRPLSEEVSRRHCAFLPEGDVLFVEDLRSRNGTFVNGTRIEGRHQLADGDLVRIGNLELKVVSREAADAANRDDSRVAADSTSRGDNKTAGGRTNAADGSDDEVSRWLMADDDPAGMFDTTRAIRVADDATMPVSAESPPPNPPAEPPKSAEDPEATVVRGRPTTPAGGQKKSGDTSRTAAAEALKKFFGNR